MKEKEGKRRDSNLDFYPNLTVLPQGQEGSHLDPAKSFNLNKTDVIIPVNTSKVV